MKKFLSLTACGLSISLLAACASGPDRDKELALNQQVGIEVTQTPEGVQVRLPDRVLFDFNKAALRRDSGSAIQRAVVLLKRSNKSVIVEGHTDNSGTHEYNQALSEQRAQTVASALEDRGIVSSRIATKGFAYDRPAASNDTPEGQAKNRRTEIVVVGESLDAIMGKPTKRN
ncbi:OmpA family protein [Caballeronia sp. INDeC2]|uniref:OmpA family protein n=1 Tax=Caballeronia sp. INDeC2 TaxID=2921747 RepID=UPI0020279AE9|nr:OmpA family protein [Caballeronia sp. INDeC2]